MESFKWIIDVVIIYFCFQYTVGPILVWWSHKMPDKYKLNLLDTDNFLSKRSQIFLELHSQIQDNNFIYIGSSELIMGKSSLYFSLYNNDDKQLACTLVTASASPIHTTHIEFTKTYEDGSVLDVSNALMSGVYPESKMKLQFRFPHINDFNKLLKVTEKLVSCYKNNAVQSTLSKNNEFSEVEGFLNMELIELIENGWVKQTNSDGFRRLTIKGALLMTWKMIWPIKQILNYKDVYTSKQALKNA